MLALYIVTLGTYRLYWLAKTRSELQEKTKLKIPTVWILVIPYILVIVSVVLIMTALPPTRQETDISRSPAYRVCSSSRLSERHADCVDPDEETQDLNARGTVGFGLLYGSIIFIFPLVGWWYWQYAKAVEKVTHEKMSFPVTMLIMLAVPDIFDILILQDSYNKLKTK